MTKAIPFVNVALMKSGGYQKPEKKPIYFPSNIKNKRKNTNQFNCLSNLDEKISKDNHINNLGPNVTSTAFHSWSYKLTQS